MGLGLERSETTHFYFPENTDILIFYKFEVGQTDENILQNEYSRINSYSQSYQFQRDLTDKPL